MSMSMYYFDSSSANNPSHLMVFFFQTHQNQLPAMDRSLLIVDGGWLLQTKVVRDESIEPQLCGGDGRLRPMAVMPQ